MKRIVQTIMLMSAVSTVYAGAELLSQQQLKTACIEENTLYASDGKTLFIYGSDAYTESQELVLPGDKGGIRCIAATPTTPTTIFVGTDSGIYLVDSDRTKWMGQVCKGLPVDDIEVARGKLWILSSGEIKSCGFDGSALMSHAIENRLHDEYIVDIDGFGNELWALGAYGIYYAFAKNEKFYSFQTGTVKAPYRSFDSAGGYCAAGTGNGEIILFDKFRKEKNSVQLPENDGIFVTAVLSDGSYLWVGTFDGVYVFDVSAQSWINTGSLFPSRCIVDFFLSNSHDLFVGTDQGLFRAEKPYVPFAMTAPRTYAEKNPGAIEVVLNDMSDVQRDELKFAFRQASFPERWHEADVSVSGNKIIWHTISIAGRNERYELRGEKRTCDDSVVVYIDAGEPAVYIDPVLGVRKPGPYTVTGRFNTSFIDTILLYPGETEPLIDSEGRTFKAVINLNRGKNTLTAELIDQNGNKTVSETVIYVRE